MSVFGASRFTAMLATVSILGTAGTLWWALETRADLKSRASGHAADAGLSSRPATRARLKDESKLAPRRSERPQPSSAGWDDERDQPREPSAPPQALFDYALPPWQNAGADMPLLNPPPQPNQETLPILPPEPAVSTPPVSEPPAPAEDPTHQARDPKPQPAVAATPNAAKRTGRPYYVEKFIEQGDSGEVKYRYRRQPCEPPNMPDVCFMPPSSRRNIVVERR